MTRESVYQTAIGGADLSARNLAKHGLRRSAYDGANGRRFVLFEEGEDDATGEAVEWRNEFSTKSECDVAAADALRRKGEQKPA